MTQLEEDTFAKNLSSMLKLPPGWFEDYSGHGPLPGSFKKKFHSDEAPTGEIFVWYRGQPLNSESSASLTALLAERPQILTKAKTEQINAVLGNMGLESVFRPLLIRTELIGEVNTLTVEGRWSDGDNVYALFIPVTVDNSEIVEIHFQAPKEDFRKNLTAVKAAFASMKWRVASAPEIVSGESAHDRLEKLTARKLTLDYFMTSHAVAGIALSPEAEIEYSNLQAEIEKALSET